MAELRDSSVKIFLDAATSIVKAIAQVLTAFIVALIQELDFLLFSRADGAGQLRTSIQPSPSVIRVTERYVDRVKVSGSRGMERGTPSGRIEVTVPYDRQRHVDVQLIQLGTLHFNSYGRSNLNRQPNPRLDYDTLPIRIDLSTHQRQADDVFDFHLVHHYQPERSQQIPLVVDIEVLDEDEAKDENAIARELKRKRARQPNEKVETVEQILLRHVKDQVGLKRSLLIRFRIRLLLPEHLSTAYERKRLELSRMTLQWPIATPQQVAKVRFWGIRSRPIIYNPEQKIIEWSHIPFYRKKRRDKGSKLDVYRAGPIELNIEEPAEMYRQQELSGSVTVELNGLLSGLQLDYRDARGEGITRVPIKLQTTLTTEFTLRLDECFEQKKFVPEQHLQFPGIILNDLRLADIIMLLRDKRFEPATDKKDKWVMDELDDEESRLRQYLIQAKRNEGTRELMLWMLIQGIDAGTTRERKIKGEEKYTTDLPAGGTVIHIRGRLEGDSKRVINVINEIQMQLKEQFRHVSAVE